MEAVGELGDDDAVADLELGQHRARWDVERLGHECLDPDRDEHRGDDQNQQLTQERGPALAPLSQRADRFSLILAARPTRSRR